MKVWHPRAGARTRWAALTRPMAAARVLVAIGGIGAIMTSSPALANMHPTAAASAAEALGEARQSLDEVNAALDAVVRAYEQSSAHHLRLTDELAVGDERTPDADVRVEVAREAASRRAVAAYTHPDLELTFSGAVLSAPDAATVVHRAALVRRLAVRGRWEIVDRERARDHERDRRLQRELIAAGAARAAADGRRLAEALAAAADDARGRVARAEADLAAAERPILPGSRGATTGAMTCPVGGPNGFIDSWGFPRSGGRRHEGVDMFAAYGTPLRAVADGLVLRVSTNRLGGLAINLRDTSGDRYYYAHLSTALVRSGQLVHAGDVIGAVCDSGNAAGTPPHLHFEYHPGGGPAVNPYPLAVALCRSPGTVQGAPAGGG
jgi:peptidoglycan LD-endopeptidase LytH